MSNFDQNQFSAPEKYTVSNRVTFFARVHDMWYFYISYDCAISFPDLFRQCCDGANEISKYSVYNIINISPKCSNQVFVNYTQRFRTCFPPIIFQLGRNCPLDVAFNVAKTFYYSRLVDCYFHRERYYVATSAAGYRYGKCRPENLPFYKLSRALTTKINPLYSSGMIPGACTIRRTNKSDSGVTLPLSLSLSSFAN